MKFHTLIVRGIATALTIGIAAIALGQSLDIEPGLWKKTVKMETGGRTVMDSTIDACLTADDLDLQKTAAKLTQSPSCKVLQQEMSTKKLKIVLQCNDMLAESTTEVRSRESVVVTAILKPAGGAEETHTSEQWTFVKADCVKNTSN